MPFSKLKKRTEEKGVDAAIIGATENEAGIFAVGLYAFVPFTFQQYGNTKTIEYKNLLLKGKWPVESEYYHFNDENRNLGFTATDGSRWEIDIKILLTTQKERLNEQEIGNDDALFHASLKNLKRMNLDFSEMSLNHDPSKGQWIVLYSEEVKEKLHVPVSFFGTYGQNARHQLFTKPYKILPEINCLYNNPPVKKAEQGGYLLNGGLLVNKQTTKAIRLNNPESYLVIYKSQIGASGEIMLCRLAEGGKLIWKPNTYVTSWIDCHCLENRILIFASSNKMTGSSEFNLLLTIDL